MKPQEREMRQSIISVAAAGIIAAAVSWQAAAVQQPEAKLDQLFTHVAPAAQIIIAIPSLKRLNDDITELLGGMDRADMIAAGRPIDMAKSMLGLGGGIDDRRGAALVLVPGEDAMPTPLALIPVIDPDGFLETNFKYDDATGAYTGSTGEEVFIRELDDNYMLLSENKQMLEHYKAGEGARAALDKRFGAHAESLLQRGELLVLMDQSGARFAAANFGLPGSMMQAGFPADPEVAARIAAQREKIISQIAGLAYVLDADPLGVTVHGLVTFEANSTLAGALKPQTTPPMPWTTLLPKKPYYLAVGVDLKSAGALEAIEAMAPMFQVDLEGMREVLASAQQVAFIASPSPAGFTGGLLNDAALVIRTDNPEAMHAKVRDAMARITTLANERLAATMPENAPGFQVAWTDDKAVGDDGLVADAYEVRAPVGGDMMIAMARSAVFGQNQRGFLTTAKNAVVMTFSQRPAVLAAALKAVNGDGDTLAGDDVLAAVRQWMGEQAPAEVFISLGQLNKFAVNAARSFGPMTQDMVLPELDPNGPPIALTFGVGERSMTSALALPAPLLADILREFERAFRPFNPDVNAQ
jgi:hypothetical protein